MYECLPKTSILAFMPLCIPANGVCVGSSDVLLLLWVGWVIETTTSVFLALSPGHPSLEEASCHGTGPLEEAHEARN